MGVSMAPGQMQKTSTPDKPQTANQYHNLQETYAHKTTVTAGSFVLASSFYAHWSICMPCHAEWKTQASIHHFI